MEQFSTPHSVLLPMFYSTSSQHQPYLNSSSVFHTKYTSLSLQSVLIPPTVNLMQYIHFFFRKHSVIFSTSHVSQAELLPQNLLCRLIQQILFRHQTFSYLPLHFFCLFCTQTELVKKKTVSFLAALSAEADKTFNAVILITSPLQSINETGWNSSTSVGCGSTYREKEVNNYCL